MKNRRNVCLIIGRYTLMILLVPIFLYPIILLFISSLKSDYYQGGGEIMAYLSMVSLPVPTLFLLLQNTFMESIATTGLKG